MCVHVHFGEIMSPKRTNETMTQILPCLTNFPFEGRMVGKGLYVGAELVLKCLQL